MKKLMMVAAAFALTAPLAVHAKRSGLMISGPSGADMAKLDQLVAAWRPQVPAPVRKVLVCDQSEAYRHGEAIGYARYALMRLAAKGSFLFDYAQDFEEMRDRRFLARYDAILLNCTTATEVKKHPGLECALTNFVAQGKGLCLIHAAVDSFYDSPVVQEMNGGLFWSHPWHVRGVWQFINECPEDPINAPLTKLGSPFHIQDEIYMQQTPPFDRSKLRVLQSIDLSDPATGQALEAMRIRTKGQVRADKDFAVSWVKDYGRGRVFYTTFGHDKRAWLDPVRVAFMLNGLQFCTGDLKTPTTSVKRR